MRPLWHNMPSAKYAPDGKLAAPKTRRIFVSPGPSGAWNQYRADQPPPSNSGVWMRFWLKTGRLARPKPRPRGLISINGWEPFPSATAELALFWRWVNLPEQSPRSSNCRPAE